MFSSSFHVIEARDMIAKTDPSLAGAFFKSPHSRRYAIAEMFRDVLIRRGEDGNSMYDRIFARLEMHAELTGE